MSTGHHPGLASQPTLPLPSWLGRARPLSRRKSRRRGLLYRLAGVWTALMLAVLAILAGLALLRANPELEAYVEYHTGTDWVPLADQRCRIRNTRYALEHPGAVLHFGTVLLAGKPRSHVWAETGGHIVDQVLSAPAEAYDTYGTVHLTGPSPLFCLSRAPSDQVSKALEHFGPYLGAFVTYYRADTTGPVVAITTASK